MRTSLLSRAGAAAALAIALPLHAQTLDAERAVQIALRNNSQVIQAEASVLDARGGLWSAYSGVLPHVSASLSRGGSYAKTPPGVSVISLFDTLLVSRTPTTVSERYTTTPGLNGSWALFNWSALRSLRSAQHGMTATLRGREATRNDAALAVRRQFYEVVKAVHLSSVASSSLGLARDNERRVKALFEVGSVSKSDLLKSRVQTAQSQLDSLRAHNAVTSQRIELARLMGVAEREVGEVDTTLVTSHRVVDESALLAEAERSRPDVQGAAAELRAAEAAASAAGAARLPYVTVSGGMDFNTRSNSRTQAEGQEPTAGFSNTDRSAAGQVALNLDVFDGFARDGRIASARSRLIRATETRAALLRNLASEVQQAVLTYQEAVESEALGRTAVESAAENLNLVQQKYNVGSATILDLIDAQVQFQRAQNELVTARAAVRQADALIDRVRGRRE